MSLGLVLEDEKQENVKVRVSFRSRNPARLTPRDLSKLQKHYDSAEVLQLVFFSNRGSRLASHFHWR